jgi:SurA N-terminal domain
VIDGIVVVVNREPLLLSDWDEAVRVTAFLNLKPLASMTATDRRALLDRLIDQRLISQEMRRVQFAGIADTELARRAFDLRKQIPAGVSDAKWNDALREYGITEEQVREYLRREVDELRFLDARFRPTIKVEAGDIDRYYREQYVPKMRRAGAREQPLKEVTPKIEEILAAQRVNELMSDWLRELRQGAVEWRMKVESPASVQRAGSDTAADQPQK